MNALYRRLTAQPRDAGLSLIEVIAAMMIFAVVALTIGYALASSLVITRDNQARETAINLASAELDAVRSIGDPFAVFDASNSITVGTNTYQIDRATRWVTPGGDADICGVGGGPLQYKSVSVTVTWQGMRNVARPVTSDTALVPVDRINDPTKGTIIVNVIDSYGVGLPGVTLTAKRGAVSVPTSPTNADGCSFVLKVDPGDYTIELTNAGFVSHENQINPSITLEVAAGASTSYNFQFDRAATYRLRLASNGPSGTEVPVNHDISFFNANGITQITSSSRILNSPMFPNRTGFEIVSGNYVPQSETGDSCRAVDPLEWDPDPVTGETGTRASAYAGPGDSVTVDVPMGLVEVTGGGGNPWRYLYAVSQDDVVLPGQPECDVTMDYSFGQVIPSNSSNRVTVALPFGSWKLYYGNSSGSTRHLLDASRVSIVTPGQSPDGNGLLVLDPRGVTP